MAVTQYIGARYVPLFYTNPNDNSNNWLAGVKYEPLTIVTDINQSYTSKIPVPANIGRPSENPTYWILTGDYNAQIEQYRQITEQYSQITESTKNKFDNLKIYNVLDYGAYGNGIHNDTNAIQTCIDAAELTRGLVYFPEGTYIVNGITIDDFIDVYCVGVLKASNICTNVLTLDVPYFADNQFSNYYKHCVMTVRIDGSNTAEVGINAVQGNHILLENSSVYGVTNCAVKMTSPNPEFVIDHIFIEGYGDTCTGFIVGADCEIHNVIMKDCHTGFVCGTYANISNIHAWLTRNYVNSVLFEHTTGTLIVNNIYCDTYQYLISKVDDSGTITLDNIYVYNNPTFTGNNTGYIFKAADKTNFRYCLVNNLTAARVNLSNISDGFCLGLVAYRFTQVVMPARFNLYKELHFTGETSGESYVTYNTALEVYEFNLKFSGSFDGSPLTITSAINSISKEKNYPIVLAGSNQSVYDSAVSGTLYVANNGNIVVKSSGLVPFTGCLMTCAVNRY